MSRMEVTSPDPTYRDRDGDSGGDADDDETVWSEKKKRSGFVGCLINNWFMISTIIGVIIGFGAGFGIQQAGLSETGKVWLGNWGAFLYI